MDLKILKDNRALLLACEALGFLHNIGKLDNRFQSKDNFDFQQVAKPDECLSWDSEGLMPLRDISKGKSHGDQNACAKLLAGELIPGCETDAVIDAHWKKSNRYFPIAIALETPHFASACHLIKLRLFDGVGLDEALIKKFVDGFVEHRGGGESKLEGLEILGKNHSFALLLNLFWDDFHWRPSSDFQQRTDNLTHWLGDDYENFSHFARIMAVCHEAISRGDKGADSAGDFVNLKKDHKNWTNVFGSGEKPIAQHVAIAAVLDKMLEQNQIQGFIDLFKKSASDGRLPVNDVSLYAYCYNFGAFLKTATAGILLNNRYPEPHELKWRLLWFRVDGMEWIGQGGRLADAVARNKVWEEVLAKINHYLEVQLPVAQCIYTDTNGAFYLAPDIEDLLDRKIDTGTAPSLREKICRIAIEASRGEIALRPQLSGPMKGYDVKISAFMDQTEACAGDPATIKSFWRNQDKPIYAEVCTVCALRPIASKGVAQQQRVCEVCNERRTGRVKQWRRSHGMTGTVWTSELADKNGRSALLVGSLKLGDWLNGKLFQSLVGKWTGAEEGLLDGPSFTRVRDVWNTTARFWNTIDHALVHGSPCLAPVPGRCHVVVSDSQHALHPDHAYEIAVTGGRWQVVCFADEADPPRKRLVVVDRRAPVGEHALEDLRAAINGNGDENTITVYQRSGYGGIDSNIGEFSIVDGGLSFDDQAFAPYINVITDPMHFVAMMPADQVLKVAQWIIDEYKIGFNRVQDRLPLSLGVVFFPWSSPAYTVLDAGFRMVRGELPEESLGMAGLTETEETLEACLEGGHSYCYSKMICGQKDRWYMRPRFGGFSCQLQAFSRFGSDDRPAENSIGEPATPAEQSDLRMTVKPSSFDMMFLSATSKRHAIHYADADGRRWDADFGTMPLSLESLKTMNEIWKLLGRLSRSQLSQLEAAYDYARSELKGASPQAIDHYLENALKLSGTDWWKKLTTEQQKMLERNMQTKLLWTTLAHRLHLMKDKPAGEANATRETQ